MLRIVGMLVLVLIAMRVAANPKTWWWLFPEEAAQQESGEPDEKAPSVEDVDFRVKLEEGRLNKRKVDARPAVTAKKPSIALPEHQQAPSDEFAVNPALLSVIRDNTLGVRSYERDAYYTLLVKARDLPASSLERAARNDVAYTVLMINPDEFRGVPLTIEGESTRLWKLPTTKNEYGIDELYEVWIVTSDSGNRPYRVVCSSIPKGVPYVGKTSNPIRVRVTGYFFKKEGYQSEGGLTVAPLLLAGNLKWFPPRAARSQDQAWAPLLVGSVLLGGVFLCVMAWRISVGDKNFNRKQVKRLTAAPREQIEALKGIPTIEQDEMFRQISEQVEQAETADPGFSPQNQADTEL